MSDEPVTDGKWHQVVGTFDGDVQSLFVDGKLQGKPSQWMAKISGNNNNFQIGNAQGRGQSGFDGQIDEVRLYNRALSEVEVTALYGLPIKPRTILAAASSSTRPAALPAVDLKKGLVVYFPFDEQPINGVVKDKSGVRNDGSVSGAPLWSRNGTGLGQFTFKMANKTDAIVIRDNPSLALKELTLSAWIRTATKGGPWRRILEKGNSSAFDLTMDGDYPNYTPVGKVQMAVLGKNQTFSDESVADGNWHHVAGTYNGVEENLYVDGILQRDRRQWVGGVGANANNLIIGNNRIPGNFADGGGAFDGQIGEVRVYNRGLSEAEVKELYRINSGAKR